MRLEPIPRVGVAVSVGVGGRGVAVGTGVAVGGRVAVGDGSAVGVGWGTVAVGGRTSAVPVGTAALSAGIVCVAGSATPVLVASCSVAFELEQAVSSKAKNTHRLNVNPIFRYVPGIWMRIYKILRELLPHRLADSIIYPPGGLFNWLYLDHSSP